MLYFIRCGSEIHVVKGLRCLLQIVAENMADAVYQFSVSDPVHSSSEVEYEIVYLRDLDEKKE